MEPNYICISCDGEEEEEEEEEEIDDNLLKRKRRRRRRRRERTEKFTDADLENLQRDLNECQQAISQFSSGEPTPHSFHPIFFPNNPNYYSVNHLQMELLPPQTHPAPTQLPHFTRLLHDFEEFENQMLPPTTTHKDHLAANAPACTTSMDTEIQDSRMMIEEMAASDDDPGSSLFFTGNSSDPPQKLNMDFEPRDVWTSCYDVACGSGIGSCPEYAADYYDCAGDGSSLQGDGVYFQAASTSSTTMTFFGCSSVRYFICSQDSSPNEFDKPHRTRCKKKRYKGVLETEEETAGRLERTKIRNREAAAQAHLRKQSHEAHLQTLLLKLRKKNEFLKKKLMFLQGQKRTDVPPQPLRRTISGPI